MSKSSKKEVIEELKMEETPKITRSTKNKKRKIKKKFIISGICVLIFIILLISLGFVYSIKTKEMISNKADKYYKKMEVNKDFGKNKKLISYSKDVSSSIRYPFVGIKGIDNDILHDVKKIEKDYYKKYQSNKFVFNKFKYYLFVDYDAYYGVDDIVSVVYYANIVNNKNKLISENIYTSNYSLKEACKVKDNYIFVEGYTKNISNSLLNYYKDKKELSKNYKDFLKEDNKYHYALSKDGILIIMNKKGIYNKKGIEKITFKYDDFKNIINIDTTKNVKKIKKISRNEKLTDNKKIMYIKTKTNVYAKANKNSDVLLILEKGEVVEQLELGNIEFSKVNYNDKDYYVLFKYLSDKPVAKLGYTDVSDKIEIKNKAILYKEDNDKSEKIATLNKITSLSRIGKKENWNEVIYNNKIAFVKSSDLVVKSNETYLNIGNRKIDPKKPMVALTFDDGPNPSSSNRILDTLEKYNSVATFFELGSLASSYPNVIKREEKIGCEVASHTYSHADLAGLSRDGILGEVNKADNVFKKILGHDVSLLRPPYGSTSQLVRNTVNHPLILWDIDTLDWKSRNKNSILSEVHAVSDYNGRIILMHSIYETTADAVEELVPELINKGYQLVTVSELAKYKGYNTLKNGGIYYNFR